MRRKLMAVLLGMTMIAGLAACGSSSQTAETPASSGAGGSAAGSDTPVSSEAEKSAAETESAAAAE